MKVLVTGGAGQLARAIRWTWGSHDLLFPDETVLDLASREAIHSVIAQANPDVVINAGAFTQVDLCEVEPATAMLINGEAVGWLAEACDRQKALLVQISTDYVFDGTGKHPYLETDPVNPLSVYGKSKLLGESNGLAAREHLIARTAWLYDAWGRNFLLTIQKAAAQGQSLRVVNDQSGAPTSCRALARQMLIGVEEGWRGLVHCTCSGETTWHGFAHEIFQQAGIQADLSPCTTADYPLPAPRPAYSVLDGHRRSAFCTDLMPDWCEALSEVLSSDQPAG